ncbi:MAG: hypothetical protein CMP49_04150 [Flavobacteriales bacterium]|nr:hypothetical protein [Flavobacteriales bacterium]
MKKILSLKIILSIIILFTITSCDYFLKSQFEYENILIPVQEYKYEDYGFMNLNGELIIDFEIEKKPATIMYNNFSYYYEDDGKITFIKYIENGDYETIKTNYVQASLFNEGLSLVVTEVGKLTYIDEEMNEVIVLDSALVSGYFNEGLAKFKNTSNGKWGFINNKGDVIIERIYDEATWFYNGHSIVEIDGKKGAINDKGDFIIKEKERYTELLLPTENLFAYITKQECGYLNTENNKVIKNRKWTNITHFKNGLASYEKDNRWGLLNKEGEVLIRNKYKSPLFFYNELCIIEEDRKFGFINTDNNKIIEPEYENALPFFGEGAFVQDGKDWIFINTENKMINELELNWILTSYEVYNILITGLPFRDNTITSNYEDYDGFTENIIYELYNKEKMLKLPKIKTKEAANNLFKFSKKYLDSSYENKELMIDDIPIKGYYLDSYAVLEKLYAYDNNFQFSLYYEYDDHLKKFKTEKVQKKYYVEEMVVDTIMNTDASLTKHSILIAYVGNFDFKYDYLKSKINDCFIEQGFKNTQQKDSEEIMLEKNNIRIYTRPMESYNNKVMLLNFTVSSEIEMSMD